MSLRRPRARWVDLGREEVHKFIPSSPPYRGDVVLVDDERCRVVKAVVDWQGRQWTVRRLKVRPEPL